MFSPFTEYLNSLNPGKARERIVSFVEQLEGGLNSMEYRR